MSRRFWKTADSAPPLEQPEHRVPRDIFGSQQGSTTTTQNSAPWGPVQPYLQNLFQQAQGIYNQQAGLPASYFPSAAPSAAAPQASGSPYLQAATQAIGFPDINGQDAAQMGQYWPGPQANAPATAAPATPTLTGNNVANPLTSAAGAQLPSFFSQNPIQNSAGQTSLLGPNAMASLSGQASGNYLNPANNPNIAPAIGKLQNTLSSNYLDVGNNPYLKGAVEQALGMAKAGVSSSFSGDNYGGSANQEWLANKLSNTALPYYANAYQQAEQNQLGAASTYLGQANQAQNQQLLSANALMGAKEGASKLNLAGQGLNLQALGMAPGLDSANASLPWQNLQNYQSAISGNYGGQSSSQQPYFTNPLSSAVGMGLQGALIYSLLSDIRLKENIVRIGTHDETGVGIYKYNYIGDPHLRIGVMAQELERVRPEAVGEHGGFKFVDYSKV